MMTLDAPDQNQLEKKVIVNQYGKVSHEIDNYLKDSSVEECNENSQHQILDVQQYQLKMTKISAKSSYTNFESENLNRPAALYTDINYKDEGINIIPFNDNRNDDSENWLKNRSITNDKYEDIDEQILPSLEKTSFGNVSVTNSNNVRIGNTTLYKGPITIKQVMCTNSSRVFENTKIVADKILNADQSNFTVNGDSCNSIFPIYQEYDRARKWLWTWRCAAILCIFGLIFITTAVVLSVLFVRNADFKGLDPAINPDDILTEDVRFVDRIEWGAQPPEEPAEKLVILPAPYVIISHTATTPCSTQAECSKRVRVAQTLHIEGNKWSDIAYNFLVGGDGLIYEGRGWDVVGAHTFNWNKKSIGISCIGTFNNLKPTERQVYALAKLIEVGVRNKKIAKDYQLLGHRQFTETLSPGDVLYKIIKTWKHWVEKPH